MAAKNAVFHLIGFYTRKSYDVSAYLDDTAGNPVRFSLQGKAGATSPTDFQPPEPARLTDVCIEAATGQTSTQICRNGQPTGDTLLNAIHLASVNTRPILNIGFSPAGRLSAYQLA